MAKRCSLRKWIKRIVFFAVGVFLINLGAYFVYPDISRLKKERPGKTAFMLYREAKWREAGIKKRIIKQWVPLDRISPYMIKAVIIAEDDKFWSHQGFDFEAIEKAIEKNLKKKGFMVGGSTISQQVVKNLYLSPAKNPIRKLKEAILTWRLERTLSKRRIIEIYLNIAEWGDGIFGIEAAARHYFGKPASALTPEEAVRLAVVLPNPLRYSPTGKSRYVEARSQVIYRIMVRRGIVIPHFEEIINPPSEPTAALPLIDKKADDNSESPESIPQDTTDGTSLR